MRSKTTWCYKVEKGERISLVPKGKPSQTYGVKQTIPKLAWHTLKVDFHGTMFTVSLNGRQIMEVMDTTFAAARERPAFGPRPIA